jgi:hypothetical protein
MTTRIEMINQALIAIGAQPLQSETAPNGPRFVAIYKDAISTLCSEYPWQHCTSFAQLARLTVKPVPNQWAYAYALPSDMDGTPRAIFDSATSHIPVTEFEIYGGTLYTDYEALWCRFTQQPNEAIWPGWFRGLAKRLLMAEYAIPAREDPAMRASLLGEVYGSPEYQGESGLIAKCKAIDAQGKPSRTIPIGSNPLVAVRWS